MADSTGPLLLQTAVTGSDNPALAGRSLPADIKIQESLSLSRGFPLERSPVSVGEVAVRRLSAIMLNQRSRDLLWFAYHHRKNGGAYEKQIGGSLRCRCHPSGAFSAAVCAPRDGELRRQNHHFEGDRDGMGLVESPLLPEVRCQGQERQRRPLGC